MGESTPGLKAESFSYRSKRSTDGTGADAPGADAAGSSAAGAPSGGADGSGARPHPDSASANNPQAAQSVRRRIPDRRFILRPP